MIGFVTWPDATNYATSRYAYLVKQRVAPHYIMERVQGPRTSIIELPLRKKVYANYQ